MVGSDHDLDFPPYLIRGKPPEAQARPAGDVAMKLVEVAPGRYRMRRRQPPPARSTLPLPYVISDQMPPTEQVDGKFYESKSAFRRVGRALGLTEVGTSKFPPKKRSTDRRETKAKRIATLQRAIAEYKMGRRPKQNGGVL